MTPVYGRRRSRTASPVVMLAVLVASGACVSPSLEQVATERPPTQPGTGGSGPHILTTSLPPDAGVTPEPPPPVIVAPEELPGAHLFGDDQVLEVHLTLAPADQVMLEENGDEEVYVPAQARIVGAGIGEVLYSQIGMRHKGAYSLHHCWDTGVRSYAGSCAKLSYKLKFDEYTEDRLDGLKRLNLHAASNDASKLRELIAYGTFRDFGVDAPRTAVAKVIVNGAVEGLFIAVEEVDGRFTKAHFPEGGGDGNLYKEIWPRAGLDGTDVVASLKTNEAVGDIAAFLAFGAAVGNSTHLTFESNMAGWVDIDQTLRYIAVDRALKNWDGIMAFYSPTSPHNFYWYHDSGGSGRFQLVPWDMDNSLWEFDPYMSPTKWVTAAPVPDWNEEPLACNERSVWDTSGDMAITPPRCDRFLDLLAENHFNRFEGIALELLGGPFQPAQLLAKVRHFSALLEPIIADDPHLDVATWRAERTTFELLLEQSSDDFHAFATGGLRTEGL